MKNKYLLISIIVILIIISLVIVFKALNPKKKVTISNIKHFSFFYSSGYSINARTRYELDYNNNKYIAKILPNEVPDENIKEVEVPKEVVKEIESILEKYNISKWNGFNKTDKNVLDGNSFSLYITTEDDKQIEASGYMKWPDNYGLVKKELDNIFMEIYNK